MAFTRRDNEGAIFPNDRKSKDTDPDGKGEAMINGVEYWISSWNNVSTNGNKPYRKMLFTPKNGSGNGGNQGGTRRSFQPQNTRQQQAPQQRAPQQRPPQRQVQEPVQEPEYTDPPINNDDIPY